jgi:predicted NACHT family NTPase
MISAQATVLLLDGLDEIDAPEERSAIAREIDAFLNYFLIAGLSHVAVGSQTVWEEHRQAPVNIGGNQVIVTCRIVGYHAARLSARATHLTIEPMSPSAVARFCRLYVRESRQAKTPAYAWDTTAERQANVEADKLIEAIDNLRIRGVDDLTNNPLLLSILALVFQARGARFPDRRVPLYDDAIAEFLRYWRLRARNTGRESVEDEKILPILYRLAGATMHKSALGLISATDLQNAFAQELDAADAKLLLTLVRDGVGILTARAPDVFGFLHLTFQEFLAASWLLSTDDPVAAILERIALPRWREALLMALGQK